MANYTKIAIRGAGIVFIMNIFSAFLAYLFRILLARKLSVAEYGLVFAIFSLFGIVSLLKNLGLTSALAKFIAQFKVRKDLEKIKSSMLTVASILIPFSLLITLFFVLAADYFAIHYFKAAGVSILIKVYSLTYVLSAVMSIASSTFRGYQKQFYFASGEFIKEFVLLGVTFLLLLYGFSVFSPIIATVLAFAAEIIIFFPLLFKKVVPWFFKIKGKFNKPLYKKIVLFGLPVLLTGISGKVFSHMDTVLITYFRSLPEVGLYNAALPTTKILWRFGTTLVIILLPLASELWERKKIAEIRAGFTLLYKYLFVFILPMVIALFFFSETLLDFLFGNDYVLAATSLRILVVGALFIIAAKVNFSMITGFGKPKFVAKVTLSAAGINLLGNLFLIPLLGIEGAAISTSFSFFYMFLFSFFYMKKNLQIKLVYSIFVKTLLIGAVFALLMVGLTHLLSLSPFLEMIVVSSIVSLIYILLIFCLRVIKISEVKNLLKRIK